LLVMTMSGGLLLASIGPHLNPRRSNCLI